MALSTSPTSPPHLSTPPPPINLTPPPSACLYWIGAVLCCAGELGGAGGAQWRRQLRLVEWWLL